MNFKTSAPKAILLSALLLPCVAALAGDDKSARNSDNNEFSASVKISDKATAADTGLPSYPGAVPYVNEGSDSSAVNMGFTMGRKGPKLVVSSFQTPDNAEKVATFYKKALAKYGPVLDCSDPNEHEKASSKSELTCDTDKSGPSKNAFLFKAGKKDEQRIVAIQLRGPKSTFQLVYLNVKDLTN